MRHYTTASNILSALIILLGIVSMAAIVTHASHTAQLAIYTGLVINFLSLLWTAWKASYR